jgi:hypothetical protein
VSLLNLQSATGKGAGGEDLSDFDTRVKRRRKQQDDEGSTQQKPQQNKSDQQPSKSLSDRMASAVVDIFSANTEGDKQRRKDSGQAIEYKDQQSDKKLQIDKVKQDNQQQGHSLNFSSDDLTARRDFYKKAGINIDQLSSDKQAYDKTIGKIGGDPKENAGALLKLQKSGGIPEEAKRYQALQEKAKQTEQAFQRNQLAQAGGESSVGQAERGLISGLAQPIASVPGNIETGAGVVVQAVAPAGSRIQKTGDDLYKKGTDARTELANRMATAGYASSAKDNQLVAGVSQGAGSLVASLAVAAGTGSPTAAATLFGTNAGVDQTVDAKQNGASDIKSLLVGAGSGTINGLLEAAGLDKFLGATGGPVKETITRMITEGVQETLQSLSQSGFTASYTDVDLKQAIGQALQQGGLGAIVGGGVGLPMAISQSLQEKGVDPQTAAKVAAATAQRVDTVLQEQKDQGSPETPAGDTPTGPILNLQPQSADIAADIPVNPSDGEVVPESTPTSKMTDKPVPAAHLNAIDDQISQKTTELTALFKDPQNPANAAKAQQIDTDIKALILQKQAVRDQANPDMPKTGKQEAPSENVDKNTTLRTTTPGDSKPEAASANDNTVRPLHGVTNYDTELHRGVNKVNEKQAHPDRPIFHAEDRSYAETYGNVVSTKAKGRVLNINRHNAYDNAGFRLGNMLAREPEYQAIAHPGERRKLQDKYFRNTYTGDQISKVMADPMPEVVKRVFAKAGIDYIRIDGSQFPGTAGKVGHQTEVIQLPKPTSVSPQTDESAPATTKRQESTTAAPGPPEQNAPKTNRETADRAGKSPKSEKSSESANENNSREDAMLALDDYLKVPEGRQSMRSADELARLADKLNKAGQAGAIQRRGGLRSKKAYGMHRRTGKKKTGEPDAHIALQDAVIKDPRMYASVLAHEMSHAIEFQINGNTKNTLSLFGDLSKEERGQISSELKEITNALEGEAIASAKPEYYYNPTEMLARYVETLVLHPGKAESLAPLLTEKFEQLTVSQPLVADLMSALDDSLDKGYKNYTPSFLKDLRQTYRKQLGKRAGDMAYDAEVIRRAEINRSSAVIGKLIKRKFKNVKDKPEQLFRAAEAVLVTKDGVPQFGTHDFMWNAKPADVKKLALAGWHVVEEHDLGNDKKEYDLTRSRYTPDQAEQIFNDLSPEGQQLIKDFTAAKEEAKDEFNRELMKDLYHIDSKLEGWVHHYFDGTPLSSGKKSGLKVKVAAAKKQRTGAEGYVEDFQKAISKSLLELDRSEINNSFISEQLARISKPIAKGDKPEKGWVEVVADGKGGLRLPGEGMQVLIKPDEGKAVKIPQRRYQVPEELARHYREIRDVPHEVNRAAKFFNHAAKYWTLNVLVHPGTASTNFLSGAVQYGGKIVNDFYMDLLTLNYTMDRTRNNLIAPVKVLTPRGWTNAPDWLYGGYRSNQAGQFATGDDSKIDKGLNEYGDKALYVFGLVETYWKKTIALSEGSKLGGASNRAVTARLQKEEQRIITEVNKAIDTYAFDYDNKPLWLENFERHGGKLAKPFLVYPYKYTKFITHFAASGFDRTLPWQQRTAKVLTLATILVAISMLYRDREDKSTTPQGTEKTPLSLTPGGRVYVGTASNGDEMFVRTAKYPFFNVTSGGLAIAHGNGAELMDLLNEQYGSVGPAMDLFDLATGKRDQFNQYTPTSAIVGGMAAEWLPGFRILNDVGRALDPNARAPGNFVQGFTDNIPIFGDEDARAKWRGDPRTIKIPDETDKGRSINKNDRTITERGVTNNTGDILTGLLTGVYIRRINPKEAKAQQLREQRDEAEYQVRQFLLAGNEPDAATLAEEHGLTIPDETYKYYRRLDEDKRKAQIESAKKKKKGN